MCPAILSFNGHKRRFRSHPQHFQIIDFGGFVAGRIITLRGEDARLLADVLTLDISVDPTPPGKAESAVNYFLLDRTTLHGLYAWYGGSMPFADFGKLLAAQAAHGARAARDRSLREAQRLAKREGVRLTKADRDAIRADHQVRFLPLIRREKLAELVKSWQTLSAVRYEVATTQSEADEYGALGPQTAVDVREIRLKAGVRPKSIVDAVQTFFADLTARFGSRLQKSVVRGKNDSGDVKTLNLNRLIDHFGHVLLTDVRDDQRRVATDLASSRVLARMKEEATSHTAYFSKVRS